MEGREAGACLLFQRARSRHRRCLLAHFCFRYIRRRRRCERRRAALIGRQPPLEARGGLQKKGCVRGLALGRTLHVRDLRAATQTLA